MVFFREYLHTHVLLSHILPYNVEMVSLTSLKLYLIKLLSVIFVGDHALGDFFLQFVHILTLSSNSKLVSLTSLTLTLDIGPAFNLCETIEVCSLILRLP